MTEPGIRDISIYGQNDEHLCVHGPDRGNQGVYLSEGGVANIYDAPEKQTWKQGARQQKAKQKSRKSLARDMDLQFTCIETHGRTAEQNESMLIQAIGFELDKYDDDAKYARLAVSTELSGTRVLDVLQYEGASLDPKIDPIQQQLLKPILKIRSGDPDWYEKPEVSPAVFTSPGWDEVEISNPTNREMMVKWVVTGGTVTLPDFSWRGAPGNRHPGGDDAARMIACPQIRPSDNGMTVNLDPDELMARTGNNTNILARFGGRFFQYLVPPYTQKQMLPVHCSDTGGGTVKVELVQPRRWSRPWGLEWVS